MGIKKKLKKYQFTSYIHLLNLLLHWCQIPNFKSSENLNKKCNKTEKK